MKIGTASSSLMSSTQFTNPAKSALCEAGAPSKGLSVRFDRVETKIHTNDVARSEESDNMATSRKVQRLLNRNTRAWWDKENESEAARMEEEARRYNSEWKEATQSRIGEADRHIQAFLDATKTPGSPVVEQRENPPGASPLRELRNSISPTPRPSSPRKLPSKQRKELPASPLRVLRRSPRKHSSFLLYGPPLFRVLANIFSFVGCSIR